MQASALSLLGRIAAVALIWIAFVFLNWSMISSVQTEVGDFAANSLLAQDAKQLMLLDGHYSRFGFFHPGPALLYVLGFGEWAFFDVLGIAGSPLGGQFMAVVLLSAVWLVAIFGVLRLVLRDWFGAFLAAVAFFFVLSLISEQFVTSVWFPWMYALPFALLILSMGVVLAGRSWAVPYAAVASGVLINGHASFLVIVPVVVAVAMGLGFFLLRRISGPRTPWVIGAVVLGVFLLPLLIRTVVSFPGPLAEYFLDDRGTAGLGAVEAFIFTAGVWGGPAMAVVVLLTLGVLWVWNRGDRTSELSVRGWVIAILAGWIGAYIYAVFGVDDPANTYLLWFFAVMPAVLTAVLVAAVLGRIADRPVVRGVALALSAVLIVGAVPNYVGAAYPADYNNRDIPAIADTLASAPRVGRLVLDLDNSEDWSAVWSPIMGVAVELARRGEDVVCIRENWHIGFTEELRCTDAEAVQGRALVVRPGSTSVPAVFTVGDLAFTAG